MTQGISAFFNSWLEALNDALPRATGIIPSLINVVDPVKKTHTKLHLILTVLSAAMFFVPDAEVIAASLRIAVEVADVVLKSIKAAAGVAMALWPVGTADSRNIQISDLTSGFTAPGGVFDSLTDNFETSLGLVQGVAQDGVSSFLAFASGGDFTASSAPDINQLGNITDSVLTALTTYLTSIALAQNGWHILMLPGVDPSGVTNDPQRCPDWAGDGCRKHHDLGCSSGYDYDNQCNNNYWWYSADHHAAYTLNHNDGTDSTSIMNDIFSTEWSTGALLFENAAICEIQHAIRQSFPAIYATYGGLFGLSYNGSFPTLQSDDVTAFSNGTTFLPFDGGGVPALSKDPDMASRLYHPFKGSDGVLWQDFGPQGYDFRCLSQLNVTIANQWTDGRVKWTA